MIRFDGLPPEVIQAMCTPMHQILAPAALPSHPTMGHSTTTGALYLGSLSAATDKDLLRQHHITHIVHVLGDGYWFPSNASGEGNGSVWKDGFCSYRIDILDESTADLGRHLESVCGFIDRTLRSGRSLLVHCHQGISRSASITIAYLIHNHGMSFETAYAFVRRKRACIKPNSGFVRVLQEWDVACHGVGRSGGGAGQNMRPFLGRRFTS